MRILMLVMAVSACSNSNDSSSGSSNKAHASNTAPGTPIDACSLLTRDDVTSALDRKDFGAPKSKDNGTRCRYASPRGSVTIYSQPASRAQWDELAATLAREGKALAKVEGVGDAAYYWEQRLYVHRGSRELAIDITSGEPDPSAADMKRDRDDMLALARIAIDRLPR